MILKAISVFIAFVALVTLLRAYAGYKMEGYANLSEAQGQATITPGGSEEISRLSPGGAADPATEKLVESVELPAMDFTEAMSNWGSMTSEQCFKTDLGESLKPTRNFLQRTNNYRHVHPDSCSAPNHEFVGTFYKPKDGVGRYPPTGLPYPASTEYCASAE